MIGATDFEIRRGSQAYATLTDVKPEAASLVFFDFHIDLGSSINHAQCSNAESGVFLIGDIYNPHQPEKSNQAVIESLLHTKSRHAFITALMPLCGEYVILLKQGNESSLFTDACAQFTTYAAAGMDHFASRPNLLGLLSNTQTTAHIAESYNSVYASFGSNASGRGMLPANYYVDINAKKTVRYFPTAEAKVVATLPEDAVEKLAAHLKGMVEAILHRAPIALAITAGYDTRLLLSAMQHKDVSYFLYQHPKMPGNHHDIVTGQAIANEVGVHRELIKYADIVTDEDRKRYSSLWHARTANAARVMNADRKYFSEHIMLNGNIGEVARSYFGNTYPATAPILAKLVGKKGDQNVVAKMKKWLDSFDHEFIGPENVLDLLYWEEKMANWAAQSKTEYRLAGKMISPLNSHNILITLLGVEKRYRTVYRNKLFESTIAHLDNRLSKFPYNPSLKSGVIKTLIALGVYYKYKDLMNRFS